MARNLTWKGKQSTKEENTADVGWGLLSRDDRNPTERPCQVASRNSELAVTCQSCTDTRHNLAIALDETVPPPRNQRRTQFFDFVHTSVDLRACPLYLIVSHGGKTERERERRETSWLIVCGLPRTSPYVRSSPCGRAGSTTHDPRSTDDPSPAFYYIGLCTHTHVFSRFLKQTASLASFPCFSCRFCTTHMCVWWFRSNGWLIGERNGCNLFLTLAPEGGLSTNMSFGSAELTRLAT